VYFNAIKYLAK